MQNQIRNSGLQALLDSKLKWRRGLSLLLLLSTCSTRRFMVRPVSPLARRVTVPIATPICVQSETTMNALLTTDKHT